MTKGRHSRSVEDYLKAIYALTEGGEPASTSALADALEIQPASVTGMVKRLAEAGLVEHVPYRGVRLTAAGSRDALRVVRRHRVLETYLCQRLGYTWDDVHDEAERLEHAVSDTLIERMSQALGSPEYDPHGAPIPTSAGDIETVDVSTLGDALPGARVRIRAVRDEDSGGLRSMAEDGLVPGARLIVVGRRASDLATEVALGDADAEPRLVGADLARQIYVVPDEA